MDGADERPLRYRLKGYAVMLVVGLACVVVAGATWSALSDAAFTEATAWSSWILGTVMLVLGGTSGSGLSSLSTGEHGIHYGRRHEHGFADTRGEILRVQDLRERLRRGLRPAANPTAFWQVVGGLAMLGFGLLVFRVGA